MNALTRLLLGLVDRLIKPRFEEKRRALKRWALASVITGPILSASGYLIMLLFSSAARGVSGGTPEVLSFILALILIPSGLLLAFFGLICLVTTPEDLNAISDFADDWRRKRLSDQEPPESAT
ncbi:MAG: hypothetical protein AAF725_21195 [Acidobacteriota bacterium]